MNMGEPAWLADLVAVIMLVTGVYCLGRVVVSRVQRRPTDLDVDVVHGVMGVGMAAMLVPSLSPVPNVTWAWVFGVAAAWFAWRIVGVYRSPRTGRIAEAHYLPHFVMALAMIYMGVAVSGSAHAGSGGGMAMGSGSAAHFPTGALILALLIFGYVVWLTDQLPGIPSVRAWRVAPQLALAGVGTVAGSSMPGSTVPGSTVAGSTVPGSTVAGSAAEPDLGAQAVPVVRAAVAAHPGEAARLESAAQEASNSSGRAVPLSPRLEAGCHIIMAVAMSYMLILML
jgi:hypothetical protein